MRWKTVKRREISEVNNNNAEERKLDVNSWAGFHRYRREERRNRE